MRESIIQSFDGKEIVCYEWADVTEPKGVVQIAHGMSEHARRYDAFARFLNANGFVVFADDHRGHGKTAGTIEKIGVAEGDLYGDVVKDELFFSAMLKEKYNLPLFFLGHSFGSFVGQRYIQSDPPCDKAVLMGSAKMDGAQVAAGRLLAGIVCFFGGKNRIAKLIEAMSFGSYNKSVEGSWLSVSEENVKAYREDPFCGLPFTYGFYRSFFGGLGTLYTKKGLASIRKDLPILVVSGAEDAVGEMSASVKRLHETYVQQGIETAELKIYEGMRHEILNEDGKQEVYEDILAFFNK